MATKKKNLLKVTLKYSPISVLPLHKKCIKGLGLKKLNQTVVLPDDPCIRGMIKKVSYLLSVEGGS